MIKEYVLGFVTPDSLEHGFFGNRVVFIKKSKPAEQKGLFNGIGGKIEAGEKPLDAMVREFREETGVSIPYFRWKEVFSFTDERTYRVYVFAAQSLGAASAKTMEDEEVTIRSIADISNAPGYISNVRWMAPMALDLYRRVGTESPTIKLLDVWAS